MPHSAAGKRAWRHSATVTFFWENPVMISNEFDHVTCVCPIRARVEVRRVRRHQDRPGGEPQETDPGPSDELHQVLTAHGQRQRIGRRLV